MAAVAMRGGRSVSKPALAAMVTAIAGAILLFSLRTYYYTGSVNALAGTQASARSVWQPTDAGETAAENVIGSLLMVLTMNDPARIDPRSFPILIGLAAALLGLGGREAIPRVAAQRVAALRGRDCRRVCRARQRLSRPLLGSPDSGHRGADGMRRAASPPSTASNTSSTVIACMQTLLRQGDRR